MTSNASLSSSYSSDSSSPHEVKSCNKALRPDRKNSQSFYDINPGDVVERILNEVERRQAVHSTPAQVFDKSQQNNHQLPVCDGGYLLRCEIHQLGLISSSSITSNSVDCNDLAGQNNTDQEVKVGWATVDPDYLSSIVRLLEAHVISAGSINLISSLTHLIEISASPSMDLKQVGGKFEILEGILKFRNSLNCHDVHSYVTSYILTFPLTCFVFSTP